MKTQLGYHEKELERVRQERDSLEEQIQDKNREIRELVSEVTTLRLKVSSLTASLMALAEESEVEECDGRSCHSCECYDE